MYPDRPAKAFNAALAGQDQVPYKEGGFILGLVGSVVTVVCTATAVAFTAAKSLNASVPGTNTTDMAAINETLQQNIDQLIQLAVNQTILNWPTFFNETRAVNLTQTELRTMLWEAVSTAAQDGIAAALLTVKNTLSNSSSESTDGFDASAILSISIAVIGAISFAAGLVSACSVFRKARENNQKLEYETLKKNFDREKEILEEVRWKVKLIGLLLSAEENQKEERKKPESGSLIEQQQSHQNLAYKILGISEIPSVIKALETDTITIDGEHLQKPQTKDNEYELSEILPLTDSEKAMGKFLEFLDEKDDLNLYKQICSSFNPKNWKDLRETLLEELQTCLDSMMQNKMIDMKLIQNLKTTKSFADFIKEMYTDLIKLFGKEVFKMDAVLNRVFEAFIKPFVVEDSLTFSSNLNLS